MAERLEARLLRGAAAGNDTRDARAYQLELIARSRLRKQELDELEAARAMYRELIGLEPENANAHAGFAEATISLAQSFLALEFDEVRAESETAAETALRLEPGSSEAWRVRGFINRVLALRTGEQRYADAAVAALQRAVEIDPRNADALAMLAAQLLTAGQYEQATAMLRRSIEIDPLSRTAQQLLGAALESQGRLGEARRLYESLIDLYPDFTNAKVALGTSLMAQGKLDEAVALLDDPALLGADPIAGLYLANCYANLDLPQEMRATLEGIVEPPTAAAAAEFVLLQRTGEPAAIGKLITREIEATNEPVWQAGRIMLAVRAGDAAAAEAALAAMSLDPVEGDATLDRSPAVDTLLIAQALRLTGKPDQADRMVEALLRRFATAPGEYVPNDDLLLRAFALASLGRTDVAIGDLTRATEQGYRTLIDFEYFLRPEDYPFMQEVARDARYLALVSTIEADNARMRDNLIASRASVRE